MLKRLKQKVRDTKIRAKYGIGLKEAWSLDEYLANHIANCLRVYLEYNNGHPMHMTFEEWSEQVELTAEALEEYVAVHKNLHFDPEREIAANEGGKKAFEVLGGLLPDLWI